MVSLYCHFVFLVSYSLNEVPDSVWFSYYKDTRSMGERLKLGHGPSGPPVLEANQVVELVKMMIECGCLNKTGVINAIDANH